MTNSAFARRERYRILRWFVYSIVVPLFPMALALVALYIQGRSVAYETLLGGTEIYILAVTVLAATANDLDKANLGPSRSPTHRLTWILLIPFTIFMSMVFGVVYIYQHMPDAPYVRANAANAGIALGFITTAICVTIQMRLTNLGELARGE